jgi:hypothetical protein
MSFEDGDPWRIAPKEVHALQLYNLIPVMYRGVPVGCAKSSKIGVTHQYKVCHGYGRNIVVNMDNTLPWLIHFFGVSGVTFYL